MACRGKCRMQQPSQLLLPQLKMEANEGKCKVLDKMCPRSFLFETTVAEK
jgi:hypothetical protein